MESTQVGVFEHADGDWRAECLVCEEWLTPGNATRGEAEATFARPLERTPAWTPVRRVDRVVP